MTPEEKRHYWQQHIDTWRESDVPQRDYCAQAQISFSTFSYWRTKLNRARQPEGKWLPVQVRAPSAAVTVLLPGGIRLDVPPQILAEVLPVVYRSLQDKG